MSKRGSYTGGSTLLGRGSQWFSRGSPTEKVELTPAQIESNRRRLAAAARAEKYGPDGTLEGGPNHARNKARKARKAAKKA